MTGWYLVLYTLGAAALFGFFGYSIGNDRALIRISKKQCADTPLVVDIKDMQRRRDDLRKSLRRK